MPKEKGGWGILDLKTFSLSLIFKSMWRCLTTDGLWKDIINQKYLDQKNTEEILTLGMGETTCRLNIWKGFIKCWPHFSENIKWFFASGNKTLIGSQQILGLIMKNYLSCETIDNLNHTGYFYLC